jgi:hypothetical protein
MKILRLAGCLAAMVAVSTTYAQKGTMEFPKQPKANPPPKDYIVEPPPPPLATLKDPPKRSPAGDQKSPSGKPVLVTPEQAQSIITRFKEAYPKLGSPRFLVYANPELVDQQSGAKPSPQKEGKTAENAGSPAEGKPQPALPDDSMVREVERYFGRPLRDAGANLADPKAAAQVMAGKPLDAFLGTTDSPEARKDRDTLGKIADTVIEILISSRSVPSPDPSGSQAVNIPEIQATAINLKDSKIIGQASSSDVTSRVPASAVGKFGVREITEATALALMQDMTPSQ